MTTEATRLPVRERADRAAFPHHHDNLEYVPSPESINVTRGISTHLLS